MLLTLMTGIVGPQPSINMDQNQFNLQWTGCSPESVTKISSNSF